MLQKQAVEPGTFSLLKELMSLPFLQEGALVGGTALALIYGHRKSIDLDIFLPNKPNWDELLEQLINHFNTRFYFEKRQISIGIFGFIDNIKVDIVYYPHKLLYPLTIEDTIRLYHPLDIAAMKVNAILGRGKKKVFWDMATLLNHFNLDNIISTYQAKFPKQQLLISIPNALLYFEDAETSEEPDCFLGKSWLQVKQKIEQEVNAYLS
jgi:hypothetical protein